MKRHDVTQDELLALMPRVPDWPRPGVTFVDVAPLFADEEAFAWAVDQMLRRCMPVHFWSDAVDTMTMGRCKVLGIEARGFALAGAIARSGGRGLVMARKPDRLPRETHHVRYLLEYGTGELEIQKDALAPGDRVVIVDDVLATGGTAAAAAILAERAGAVVAGFAFLVEIDAMNGREALRSFNTRVASVIHV